MHDLQAKEAFGCDHLLVFRQEIGHLLVKAAPDADWCGIMHPQIGAIGGSVAVDAIDHAGMHRPGFAGRLVSDQHQRPEIAQHTGPGLGRVRGGGLRQQARSRDELRGARAGQAGIVAEDLQPRPTKRREVGLDRAGLVVGPVAQHGVARRPATHRRWLRHEIDDARNGVIERASGSGHPAPAAKPPGLAAKAHRARTAILEKDDIDAVGAPGEGFGLEFRQERRNALLILPAARRVDDVEHRASAGAVAMDTVQDAAMDASGFARGDPDRPVVAHQIGPSFCRQVGARHIAEPRIAHQIVFLGAAQTGIGVVKRAVFGPHLAGDVLDRPGLPVAPRKQDGQRGGPTGHALGLGHHQNGFGNGIVDSAKRTGAARQPAGTRPLDAAHRGLHRARAGFGAGRGFRLRCGLAAARSPAGLERDLAFDVFEKSGHGSLRRLG